MRRLFIINGWGGHQQEGWFPWLKKSMEKEGWNVSVPAMPHANHPKIETWVPYLAQQVGKPDKKTFFVGHSIGCQTILRYLATLPKGTEVGGIVLVAGWVHLTPQTTEEPKAKMIAEPWLKTPIAFERVKACTKNIVAVFSDNDPYVPTEGIKIFEQQLNARSILEKKKGHLGGEDSITELPCVKEALLRM